MVNGPWQKQRLDLGEMRKWLSWYDDNVEQALQDQQKEIREKLEWTLNNAEKLSVVFSGIVDQTAVNDVSKYMLALGMAFEPGTDPFIGAQTATKH